ncbi:hypothetical protein HID58_019353 [Brassica napus]|uniref:Uncharacterized protein n=1 Tax=Brassica napus TaxID=3708 RepID=A0ABQ8DDQ1_BRANA|nr:hypothetical protein HID58_019353 [Brassica napus]
MASDNASSHTHSQAPTVDINSPFVFNSLLVLPSSPAPLIDPLVDISLAASDEISYSIVATSSNSSDMAQKDMDGIGRLSDQISSQRCRLRVFELIYKASREDRERKTSMRQRMGILVAHAVGFWDCRLFINAATEYQPLDFGTAGDKFQGIKEVSAFLGHVQAWRVRCCDGWTIGLGVVTPDQLFCDDYYKLTYPCTLGVSLLPWSRSFIGITVMVKPGSWEALKVDLLSSRVSREQCDIGVSSCYLAVDGVSGVLTMVLIRLLL